MRTFALASFFVFAVPVFAQQRKDLYYGPDGDKLVSQCRNITVLEPGKKGNAVELTRCMDYITGVIDGAMMATDKNPSEFPACIPGQATVGRFPHCDEIQQRTPGVQTQGSKYRGAGSNAERVSL